jgi:hypothetical protein
VLRKSPAPAASTLATMALDGSVAQPPKNRNSANVPLRIPPSLASLKPASISPALMEAEELFRGGLGRRLALDLHRLEGLLALQIGQDQLAQLH